MWYNIFDNKKYEYEGTYEIECDLQSFPFLIKGGMPVPMQPYTKRMTSKPLDTLEILCYPGEENKKNTFTLYEDDGVSQNYEKGEYLKTDISYLKNGNYITIELEPYGNGYKEMVLERTIKVILPLTKKLECNDFEIKYDNEKKQNEITISKVSTKEKLVIKLKEQ